MTICGLLDYTIQYHYQKHIPCISLTWIPCQLLPYTNLTCLQKVFAVLFSSLKICFTLEILGNYSTEDELVSGISDSKKKCGADCNSEKLQS